MKINLTPAEMDGLPHRIAILGAGTMGLGVAECFAVSGLDVIVTDMTPELSRKACDRLVKRVQGHIDAGLLPTEALDRAKTVRSADDIASAVADVDLVFEAVPERLDIKETVLATSDAHAPAHAIIVSNTSSLPIDALAKFVQYPKRFLGMHWFNPPEWTPGVEVIPSDLTDPQVVETVRHFLLVIGKRPAVVRSAPGFVANRIQFALFREALACVEEGLASPQEVDEVVRSCFGFRLPFFGPFQIADMAGLDVYANIFEILENSLGDDWHIPASLADIVNQGRIGTKGGEGYYTYSDAERDALLIERDKRYAALNQLLNQHPPLASTPSDTDQP